MYRYGTVLVDNRYGSCTGSVIIEWEIHLDPCSSPPAHPLPSNGKDHEEGAEIASHLSKAVAPLDFLCTVLCMSGVISFDREDMVLVP